MSEFIEILANKASLSMRSPVYGIGINDADYMVQPVINGKQERCPYYKVWQLMLMRCYSSKYHLKCPSYMECSTSNEWLYFSNFKRWMKTQDWEGKELDKDVLIPANKEYSSNTCIFVSRQINGLLNNHAAKRGKYPQGVHFHKATGKYMAKCKVNGKSKALGYFSTIREAELRYLNFKSCLIKKIAKTQEPMIMKALMRHAELIKSLTTPEDAIKLPEAQNDNSRSIKSHWCCA